MMNLKRRVKALLLATACVAVVSCGSESEPVKSSAKSYKLLTVERCDTTVPASYPASIRGVQYVDVRPEISGAITKVNFKEGANVKRGEVLFVIDQVPYVAQVNVAAANVKSAESQVATAKLNAESGNDLFLEGVISENELLVSQNTLANAEASLALAKAQYEIAKNNLGYTTVVSPVDGVAGMTDVRVGTYVTPSSTVLVSVVNNEDMYAYFSMSESHILSLTRASGSTQALMASMPAVELKLNNGEMYERGGKVDAISGVVDRSTGSVSLRAKFPNPDMMLRDGGSGRVVINTPFSDVVVIPQVATFEIQNKIFVYKVVDGVAKSSEITVNPNNDGYEYIVTSGVEAGDVIIAEGAGLVREGTPVANK